MKSLEAEKGTNSGLPPSIGPQSEEMVAGGDLNPRPLGYETREMIARVLLSMFYPAVFGSVRGFQSVLAPLLLH